MANAIDFKEGELVTHNSLLCIIENIKLSQLGFRKYDILYVDSGDRASVAKHQISPIEVEELSDLPDCDWDTSITEESIHTDDVSEPVNKKSRFAHLTNEQLDEVASERLSRNTDHQTKWAVKLFKGKVGGGV
jgi:hypothetical protein